MTIASSGIGVGPTWQDAAEEAVVAALEGIASANIGFLYISDHFSTTAHEIHAFVRERTGIEILHGSVGIGICSSRYEAMDEPAISLMLMNLPPKSYREVILDNTTVAEEVPISSNWPVGIVHMDPRHPMAQAGPGVSFPETFLLGGLTSSRFQNAQFSSLGVSERSASVLLLDSSVSIHSAVAQGCLPLGPKHIITECEGNILLSIDDRPALEVFREELGDLARDNLQHVAANVFVGVGLPNRDTDDYVVRHLIGFNEDDQILAVAYPAKPGDTILFTRRDVQSAKTDMDRVLTTLKARLKETPRAGLYFSCVGRGSNLFDSPSYELEQIAETLGDFPLAGFFCSGEISHHELYGYTGVLVLFE